MKHVHRHKLIVAFHDYQRGMWTPVYHPADFYAKHSDEDVLKLLVSLTHMANFDYTRSFGQFIRSGKGPLPNKFLIKDFKQ